MASDASSSSSTPGRVTGRAAKVLNRLLADKQLSKEGEDWLITALDPFHDIAVRCCGYPDTNTSGSVVSVVSETQTVTLNATNFPNGADVHIVFFPHSPSVYQGTTDIGVGQNSMAANLWDWTQYTPSQASGALANAPPIYAGWNVIACQPGDNVFTPTLGVTANLGNPLSLPVGFTNTQFRLIGSAMEAVNVTPELTLGGSVTAYRVPCDFSDASLVGLSVAQVGPAITYSTPGGAKLAILPPGNQSVAQTFPRSRTWKAKDGVYQVSSLNTIDNRVTFPTATNIGYVPKTGGGGLSGYWRWNNPSTTGALVNRNVASTLPYDYVGSIFAGVPNSTSLAITTKYVLEIFPSVADSTLITLATPSPGFDPMALEIYSRSIIDQPPGVMVGENPLGEWFGRVLSSIGSFAPTLGKAISTIHPMAGQVITGLGTAAKYGGQYLQPGVNMAPVVPPRNAASGYNESLKHLRPKRAQQQRRAKKAAPPQNK